MCIHCLACLRVCIALHCLFACVRCIAFACVCPSPSLTARAHVDSDKVVTGSFDKTAKVGICSVVFFFCSLSLSFSLSPSLSRRLSRALPPIPFALSLTPCCVLAFAFFLSSTRFCSPLTYEQARTRAVRTTHSATAVVWLLCVMLSCGYRVVIVCDAVVW